LVLDLLHDLSAWLNLKPLFQQSLLSVEK